MSLYSHNHHVALEECENSKLLYIVEQLCSNSISSNMATSPLPDLLQISCLAPTHTHSFLEFGNCVSYHSSLAQVVSFKKKLSLLIGQSRKTLGSICYVNEEPLISLRSLVHCDLHMQLVYKET